MRRDVRELRAGARAEAEPERLSAQDRIIVSSYLQAQLDALRQMTRERKIREAHWAFEDWAKTTRRMGMEYAVRPERLETARKVVRERLRVIELDELGTFLETVEWDHRLYFEGNGVPKLRLTDLEMVMLAAGLIAIQEMDYEKREVPEGEMK